MGAFDPLEEIAYICKKHSVWMHVDGCYGASALISHKHRTLLAGIEQWVSEWVLWSFFIDKWRRSDQTLLDTIFLRPDSVVKERVLWSFFISPLDLVAGARLWEIICYFFWSSFNLLSADTNSIDAHLCVWFDSKWLNYLDYKWLAIGRFGFVFSSWCTLIEMPLKH